MLRSLPGLICLLGLGCKSEEPVDDSGDPNADHRLYSRAGPDCEAPIEGINRFTEEGAARGLTDLIPSSDRTDGNPSIGRGGSVVANDLDADGDIDLLFHPLFEDAMVYLNDGSGHFERWQIEFSNDPGIYYAGVNASAATDINGDFIPDIFVVAPGLAEFYLSEEQGWSASHTIRRDPRPEGILPVEFASYLSMSLGDIDGDNDLDLVLPGTGAGGGEGSEHSGGPDYVFLNEEGSFELSSTLIVGDLGSRTMVAIFTDRDNDGDQDLYIPADRGPRSAFWRNDGLFNDGSVDWVNDAQNIHADILIASMGIDGADLNQDGLLDYCITDRARPVCIMSSEDGSYFDGALAMGVIPEVAANNKFTTTGWSIDFVDLDNDGLLDIFQSSGPEGEASALGLLDYPDLVWQGTGTESFVDISEESGIGSADAHYGQAIADFDGNGWLDLAVAGPSLMPKLYMSACGDAGWLSLDLVGPGNNTEAIGARVEATLDNRTDVREVTGLRAQSQNPSGLHYGLGSAEFVGSLKVTWPDGQEEVLEQLAAGHHYTLVHPDAQMPPWLEAQ